MSNHNFTAMTKNFFTALAVTGTLVAGSISKDQTFSQLASLNRESIRHIQHNKKKLFTADELRQFQTIVFDMQTELDKIVDVVEAIIPLTSRFAEYIGNDEWNQIMQTQEDLAIISKAFSTLGKLVNNTEIQPILDSIVKTTTDITHKLDYFCYQIKLRQIVQSRTEIAYTFDHPVSKEEVRRILDGGSA